MLIEKNYNYFVSTIIAELSITENVKDQDSLISSLNNLYINKEEFLCLFKTIDDMSKFKDVSLNVFNLLSLKKGDKFIQENFDLFLKVNPKLFIQPFEVENIFNIKNSFFDIKGLSVYVNNNHTNNEQERVYLIKDGKCQIDILSFINISRNKKVFHFEYSDELMEIKKERKSELEKLYKEILNKNIPLTISKNNILEKIFKNLNMEEIYFFKLLNNENKELFDYTNLNSNQSKELLLYLVGKLPFYKFLIEKKDYENNDLIDKIKNETSNLMSYIINGLKNITNNNKEEDIEFFRLLEKTIAGFCYRTRYLVNDNWINEIKEIIVKEDILNKDMSDISSIYRLCQKIILDNNECKEKILEDEVIKKFKINKSAINIKLKENMVFQNDWNIISLLNEFSNDISFVERKEFITVYSNRNLNYDILIDFLVQISSESQNNQKYDKDILRTRCKEIMLSSSTNINKNTDKVKVKI